MVEITDVVDPDHLADPSLRLRILGVLAGSGRPGDPSVARSRHRARKSAVDRFPRAVRGTELGMTDPEEQTPEVEQQLAKDLEPERHRAPSEGVPRDLADDESAEPSST